MSFFNNNVNSNVMTRDDTFSIVLRQVYLWMTLGLLATAGTAFIVAHSALPGILVRNPLLLIGAIIVEFALVMFISARITKLDPATAGLLFLAYAVLNGVTLSFIFLSYNLGTITYAAIAAGAMFAATSIVAFFTKIDLSRFGGLLLMALIGLIVATLVNLFVASDTLAQVINYVGVLLFVGLTAYDTQRIRKLTLNVSVNASGEVGLMSRVSILGALTLYLDLINLFLFLLRILGRRR